ncbi:MAG: hypothetical protein WDZ88_03870 [Candidatus Paceibacterota bacterium]
MQTKNNDWLLARRLTQSILMLTIVTLVFSIQVAHADDDLVIDGVTTTIPGGTYRMVLVKNSGSLIIDGTLEAQEIYLETNGALTVRENIQSATLDVDGALLVSGNLNCERLTIAGGVSTVLGTNNFAPLTIVGGELVVLGFWNINNLTVINEGKLRVHRVDGNLPQSGTVTILANNVLIEEGGIIDGLGAGNDLRGQGNDWYTSASAGGHIGTGGRGYWTSSSGVNRGQSFGSPFTYEAYMGGASGRRSGLSNGGAGILIEAEYSLTVNGTISADGRDGVNSSHGGGAGGTVLLRSANISISGTLSANGGDGGYHGGGGGGGAIKVFYGNATMGNLDERTSSTGGKKGGYLNTQNGGKGSVYRDYIPKVESLITPVVGETLPNGTVAFSFSMLDLSATLDERADVLSPRIELSTDGFKTVSHTFDHVETFTGWNKVAYESGDTAEFTTQTPLPSGAYQWRVMLRDQSLYSRPTIPQTFFVGDGPPNTTLVADMTMTPSVVIYGAIGSRCAVEYKDVLSEEGAWHTLAIVTIETNPQLYFDVTGIGESKRFYRIQQVP